MLKNLLLPANSRSGWFRWLKTDRHSSFTDDPPSLKTLAEQCREPPDKKLMRALPDQVCLAPECRHLLAAWLPAELEALLRSTTNRLPHSFATWSRTSESSTTQRKASTQEGKSATRQPEPESTGLFCARCQSAAEGDVLPEPPGEPSPRPARRAWQVLQRSRSFEALVQILFWGTYR